MKNVQKFLFKIVIVFILSLGVSSCCDHKESIVKVDEPKEIIIPIEQAKEMYDTYTERRKVLIENFEDSLDNKDSLGNQDDYDKKRPQEQNQKNNDKKAAAQQRPEGFKAVRYIDYKFDDLKQYMAFIEQEAKKAGVNISTLRFYLANYPNKDKFGNGREVKDRRRNTVVMVPSLNKGGKEYAFFTGDDSDDGKRKAFLLTEELAEDGTSYTEGNHEPGKASFSPSFLNFPNSAPMPAENQQSLAGNEGSLRPPK